MARERALWINRRQPFMGDFLHRLAFIDETSLKTNMIKKTGWAPRGERLIDHAPSWPLEHANIYRRAPPRPAGRALDPQGRHGS